MQGDPILIIDSCCDLPLAVVEELGVEVMHFPYILAGEQRLDDFGKTYPHAEFYASMRAGGQPTTAQIPKQAFLDTFRAHAEAGEPVLYLGFSSALSGTFDVAWLARREIWAEFPDAEIRLVDTKAAAVHEGLLVYEAALRWRDGMPLADVEAWVVRERPRLQGWFVIDDLDTLRRGGRLSGAVAAAGSLLDVKPLLHVSHDGRLEVKRSIRGRQKAMRSLADLVAERAVDTTARAIAVAHGDCPDDARRLRNLVAERVDVADIITMEVGPVIGAHTGPGMLAVAFWCDAR